MAEGEEEKGGPIVMGLLRLIKEEKGRRVLLQASRQWQRTPVVLFLDKCSKVAFVYMTGFVWVQKNLF